MLQGPDHEHFLACPCTVYCIRTMFERLHHFGLVVYGKVMRGNPEKHHNRSCLMHAAGGISNVKLHHVGPGIDEACPLCGQIHGTYAQNVWTCPTFAEIRFQGVDFSRELNIACCSEHLLLGIPSAFPGLQGPILVVSLPFEQDFNPDNIGRSV